MSIDPTKLPDPPIPYYTLTIYNLYLFEKSKFKDYDSLLGNRFAGRQARANNLASVLENGYAISANGTLVRIHDEHESKVATKSFTIASLSSSLFCHIPGLGRHLIWSLQRKLVSSTGVEAHEAFFLQTPMKYCLFKHPDEIISRCISLILLVPCQFIYTAVNSNNFTGEIPPIHDNLSKLYWLDLADNQLIGSIPVLTSSSSGLYLLKKEEHLRSKLENHHNAGKTPDDAFTAVFGKDKPGRVRGYGRS
ncbi:hypothetical protein FXO38_29241 [Capsicum annuum]|nr:hypothetical protein FXO38_29241 [Capsicum annuum]